MLALGEETAVQAVVGSIVWAFSQAQKAKVWGYERLRLRASWRVPQTFLFWDDVNETKRVEKGVQERMRWLKGWGGSFMT